MRVWGMGGEPRCPPEAARVDQAAGGGGKCESWLGTEGRRLGACSLLPHKGQKGTWEETGPLGEAGGRSGPVSGAPGAVKQLLLQRPIKAQGRCAERAGASRGERG